MIKDERVDRRIRTRLVDLAGSGEGPVQGRHVLHHAQWHGPIRLGLKLQHDVDVDRPVMPLHAPDYVATQDSERLGDVFGRYQRKRLHVKLIGPSLLDRCSDQVGHWLWRHEGELEGFVMMCSINFRHISNITSSF